MTELVIGGRRSGKTYKAIQHAIDNDASIITPTREMARSIYDQYRFDRVYGAEEFLRDRVMRAHRDFGVKDYDSELVFDNAEMILRHLFQRRVGMITINEG